MSNTPTHVTRKGKPRPAVGSRSIRQGKCYACRLGGELKLEGEVSPYVFMYPGYPLQLSVTLRRSSGECLGVAYAADRSKTVGTATEADVRRLLAAVRIRPCRRCAAPAFDRRTIDTNRAGLCEPCFMHDLEAESARAEEAERQELAARDRRMKGEGMRFRVSAWVHPENGGDDALLHWYFAAPRPKQIRMLLREEGSSILDDYQMVTL